jgi:hypothetical protein
MSALLLKDDASKSLWTAGPCRLFLSHLAADKEAVGALKRELAVYGISAFVAHDDIEVHSIWQDNIEMALKTMDALVALISPDYEKSYWTNQEIGFALGRGVAITAIRVGNDPKGFISKIQYPSGQLEESAKLADQIVEILLKEKKSSEKLVDSLIYALKNAGSFESSKRISRRLEVAPFISPKQLAHLIEASEENFQVSESYGVPERIQKLVGIFGPPDYDLPF